MPPQFFYSFDDLYLGYYDAEKQSNLAKTFKNAGVSDQVKMISIPKSKNVLIVRLENLADLFDKNAET